MAKALTNKAVKKSLKTQPKGKATKTKKNAKDNKGGKESDGKHWKG